MNNVLPPSDKSLGTPDESYNNGWRPFVPERQPLRLPRHIILFICTTLTALLSGVFGAFGFIPDGFSIQRLLLYIGKIVSVILNPSLLMEGMPYAFSIMAILLAHEMGHYVLSRYHGVETSLPYFIPLPLFFGTLGAVIVSRSPYPDRKALMDIGAAGPIAGFIVALPIMAYGVALSTVQEVPIDGGPYITLGEPLILQLFSYLTFGPLPEGHDIFIHPMALGAWFGCIVTMINLLPVGQLDGGHILYAFAGGSINALRIQIVASIVSIIVTLYLGLYVFAVLLIIMSIVFRFRHPTPLDNRTPLDSRRKLIALVSLIILIITFMPNIISFKGL